MANIAPFDPFGALARFQPFFDFDESFGMPSLRAAWPSVPAEPRIKIDISEDDAAYRVKAEVPGVKKEDIKIALDGNQVTISAEVKKETEQKRGETVVRSERYYGSQYRAFTLAHAVDEGKAEAKYSDGILEITLPKKASASTKQVEVK